jgi:hypothetical protein
MSESGAPRDRANVRFWGVVSTGRRNT